MSFYDDYEVNNEKTSDCLKRVTFARSQGDAVRCFEAQSSLHSALNHIFGSSTGNWLVPALHTVCRNTRLTALAADSGRKAQAKLQGAVTLLQESFSKTLNDRIEYQVRRLRVVSYCCFVVMYAHLSLFSRMHHSVKLDQRKSECCSLSMSYFPCTFA